MQKNIYLWIFIVLAIVLCGSLLLIAGGVSDKNKTISQTEINGEDNNIKNGSNNLDVVQKEVNLTVEDVDFDEDADDLADDFIDDSSFDIEPSLDSVENEIY